jgi:hypothetical protein
MDKKFCVYETNKIEYPQHNYIGKASIDSIRAGYKGGGVLINFAFKKHGKGFFKTTILKEFDTEEEAYVAEVELISSKKPYYNIHPGGPTVWDNKPTLLPLDLEECDFSIPFKVITNKSLLHGTLRLYLLLVKLCMKVEYVQVSHAALSEILAMHQRTVGIKLKELEKLKYIKIKRVGLNMPNKIFVI